MVSYRLIGIGETDEHGVAHITKDAEGQTLATPGYTGVGAGELDMVASTDNPIASGSVVSEPYTVLDALFYDGCVTGNNNNTGWTKSNATFEVLSDGSGTEYTATSAWGHAEVQNSNYYSNLPFVIEFEVVAISGGTIRLYIGNNNNFLYFNTTGKYRAEVTDNGITVTKDNASYQTLDAPTSPIKLDITSNTQSAKATFKDFKVYPI